ncbi:type IX secretion system membrane protein PorP/SprF [Pedobacter gandavensis]|uniref:PorP/SprF family type IX secretion system membrane protein n=1 Tax=Pedobacter gandavensis TaxID=2679963 RepID=UPI002930446D|nr:type IX secretion system membrane protein PorP/SprF [Pedobacter gandavensis]
MKKLLLLFIYIGLSSGMVKAQQDAQYTDYMYNTISFNPGYTGTREALSILGLYRNQWAGLNGAPETVGLSAHAPVGKKVGLGINISNDKIFVVNEIAVDFFFSYQLDLSEKAKLSLGLKGGINQYSVDFTKANTGGYDPGDYNLNNSGSTLSPQTGFGAFYYTDNFYAGISIPNLLNTSHFSDVNKGLKNDRLHLYYIIGKVFNFGPDIKFKPSGLVKMVSGSPLQVDVSSNVMFADKFTLGLAYRWDAALSCQTGFQISDKYMIGYAYDWETTKLAQYNHGSHEIFLRYELFSKRGKILSPRFF